MRDFAQLEDFNRKVGGDDEYAKDYFEILVVLMAVKAKKGTIKKLSPETIGQYNEKRHWQRTFTR